MTDRQRTAVVVGGGLAGITAALRLADAGLSVTLVEGRPRLGGLAFSFRRGSAAGDLWVDNGQHVFLRCCTAYRGLLQRLDATGLVHLQRRLDVPVLALRERGESAADSPLRLGRLRRSGLPVPLHLSGSLSRYPHLSVGERAMVARAALALRTLDLDDPALDERSFGDWLREQRQSPGAVAALWDLVGVATLNARADDVSLALAAMVFKTGLLSEPGAADIGWSRVPLGAIHHDAAGAALDRAGVRVLLRTRVEELKSSEATPYSSPTHEQRYDRRSEGRSHSLLLTGERLPGGSERLEADTVVLAVPQDTARELLPPGALEHPERLDALGTAPILNVHVLYDRKVLRRPFFAALGSSVQWVFDRTEHSGLAGGGQYLALSQSAAQDEIDLPVGELRRRYLPELERLLPAARTARVTEFFVTRERKATFAPVPGSAPLRARPRTRIPDLYLAGAWTATGWPATMEGAVRSGHAAADQALSGGSREAPRGAAEGARWTEGSRP
ncbi:hydroxysqualene dehydroxylase HpnE [Phaeacidiphilus oryzae]|uniref:hydroxysqualene dehydroxylase HpnE n=1 Tax=Phaeacidiphilus oryzae TaxID=348818 RepID=UPI00068DA9F1|nr:hydroxysqualene dehydroxylase HpnE [Phaeacidiphilus oryzae]